MMLSGCFLRPPGRANSSNGWPWRLPSLEEKHCCGSRDYSSDGQQEALVRQFLAKVDAAYQEILGDFERGNADLPALSRRYQQVRSQDYFHSELGKQVAQT